ncbi:SprT family zinc-dependent metalloprotease [Paraglaciecola aestuariivivens]
MICPNQQKIIQQVTLLMQHANEYLQQNFAMPQVTFNQRGKVAASARLQTHELRFNSVLLNDNLSEFLSDVVPHEICHLLAFQLFGRVKPHGKEWQNLMRTVFERQPQTYHKMNVTKVAGKTFTYHCACGPLTLSIRRHNKVKRGQQQYICRKCKSVLRAEITQAAH